MIPPCSRTLSSSRFSSNWNPYWNPEQPPPCTKMRSGLPSESGIVFAKYLTFSTAASVSASRDFASLIPVGVDPVGCPAPVGFDPVGSEPVGGELGVGVIVEDIRKLLFAPGQSNSA